MLSLLTLPFKLVALCLSMAIGLLRAALGLISFVVSHIFLLAILIGLILLLS